MKRRTFIAKGSILVTGLHFRNLVVDDGDASDKTSSLYSIFKKPGNVYRPFVRWWWNGDKIEKEELARELRLLSEAGIGGVEINPIKFPSRTDDLGKRSIQWLSDEWIDLLKFAFDEARSLGLTCDLIVGSGWPFGAEWLEGEERAQVVVVGTKKIEGPLDYEISLFELFKEADPPISSPFPGRKMEMMSVALAPSMINGLDDIVDLSSQVSTGSIRHRIPKGKHVVYAMVKIHGFMEVIQGAPGATGPVLNHYNEVAVRKYLERMSDAIQKKIGPLSQYIRSLFTDSLELEGSNWCADMAVEFKKRRGYDIMPYLPFILYKIAGMGNTWVYDHGAEHGPRFRDMINRMRYDFELTKAELIRERFVNVFTGWCRENKVQSRMQAYGRGYFPLEGSFEPDIPEAETWIRAGLGSEMNENDYRIGRAYTMVNKFVSSAAHLKGKKLISCEELTNIHQVFNESLELMKVAGDQSILSGVTHPVFHGFNYSPPAAAFPGWVIYGTFINERNPWWPYFKYFTAYKTRLSALLQQVTMFADIAILPPTTDLWSKYSAQNDPFPAVMYPEWQTLVWESIHQNGNGCDILSENVIRGSMAKNGFLQFGPRKYHSLFIPQAESIEPSTAQRIFEFVESGGKVFFIESFPTKSCGWDNHEQKDKEVQEWINKVKLFSDRCILLTKPGKDHTGWFKEVQNKYGLTPYLQINTPNKFLSQVRYEGKDAEIMLIVNSDMNHSHQITVHPAVEISSGRQPWLWDPETGERYKLSLQPGGINIKLNPADLKLIVFDKEKNGAPYQPITPGDHAKSVFNTWSVTGRHIDGRALNLEMDQLNDLKEVASWVDFCGQIIYKTNLVVDPTDKIEILDLGKVFGVSELLVNGVPAGIKWYGARAFHIRKFLKGGKNSVEVRVTTTMGNYLKSLKENRIGQYWTNEGRTIQPLQSMGMLGPVVIS